MKKTCNFCKESKSLGEFYKAPGHKKYKLGHYSKCKECCRKKGRKSYRSDPEHYKKIQRRYLKNNPESRKNTILKNQRGLTLSQYNDMFANQNGVCAICRSKETAKHQNRKTKRLSVDHSHKTGKIRGLLCAACNLAVGLVNDNPTVCDNMSYYLRNSL